MAPSRFRSRAGRYRSTWIDGSQLTDSLFENAPPRRPGSSKDRTRDIFIAGVRLRGKWMWLVGRFGPKARVLPSSSIADLHPMREEIPRFLAAAAIDDPGPIGAIFEPGLIPRLRKEELRGAGGQDALDATTVIHGSDH